MDGSFDIIDELRQMEQQGVLFQQIKKNAITSKPMNDYNRNSRSEEEYKDVIESYHSHSSNPHYQFLKILDKISDACIIIDENFAITYVNQIAEGFFQRSKEEIVGSCFDQFFEEQTASYLKELCLNVLFEKKETSFKSAASNNKKDMNFNFVLKPFFTEIIILIQKDNDTLKTDNELETSDKYRDIFELSPEGIITVNKKAIVTECNPAFLELTGFSKEEIIGKTALTLPTLPLSTKFQMAKLLQSLLKGEISKDPIPFDWKRKDGGFRKGNAIIGLLKKNGRIQGIQAILRDTTEEIAAEQKIKESQERFKALFNNSLELVYIHDFKGNFIDANDACLESLGYTREEIKYLNFQSFLLYIKYETSCEF